MGDSLSDPSPEKGTHRGLWSLDTNREVRRLGPWVRRASFPGHLTNELYRLDSAQLRAARSFHSRDLGAGGGFRQVNVPLFPF